MTQRNGKMQHSSHIWRRFAADTSGNVAIEMGLVFILLTVLLVGTFDFGRQIMEKRQMEEAARAGTQYALISPDNIADFDAIEATARRSAAKSADTVTVTSRNFCKCVDIGTGDFFDAEEPDCDGFCDPDISDGDIKSWFLEVKVSSTIAPVFRFPGLLETRKVTGESVVQVR